MVEGKPVVFVGAVEFLIQPFRDQDLLDVIGQAIDRDRVAHPSHVRRRDAA
jgi:FixJ family two-component response regulator